MSEESARRRPTRIGRRKFLGVAGVAAGASVAGGLLFDDGLRVSVDEVRTAAAGLTSRFVWLRRREDMVSLQFELVNLVPTVVEHATELHLEKSGQPAFIVVSFGSQGMAERVFRADAGTSTETPVDPPIATRLSGGSRLAFDVTQRLPIPFTTAALLSWANWTPRLVPNAYPRQIPPTAANDLRAPLLDETALELPWRVLLSPHAGEGWAHATEPVTRGGWTELWHTRLAERVPGATGQTVVERADADLMVRAVWLADPSMPTMLADPGTASTSDTAEGCRLALTQRDRYDLVRLSSDLALRGRGANLPTPIDVDQLMLSSLGGWLDARGSWNQTTPAGNYTSTLTSWHQRLRLGRDHHVRVVRKGFLFPFGHPAAYVEVTEREITPSSGGQSAAYLRKRAFVVVQQPLKTYSGDPAMPSQQRGLPFRAVRVVSATTPAIDARADFVNGSTTTIRSFVPKVGGSPYTFTMRGTDWSGAETTFHCPAVFVFADAASDATYLNSVRTSYNATPDVVNPVRETTMARSKITMAPSAKPGDTTVTVGKLVFAADAAAGPLTPAGMVNLGMAPFFPRLLRASVVLPEVAALAGGAVAEAAYSYFAGYLTGEFGTANTGQVFLEAYRDTLGRVFPPALSFGGANTGGVATPNILVKGLSRTLGPIATDAADAAQELFDPVKMFGDLLEAKILGAIPLKDVLQGIVGGARNVRQSMRLVRETLSGPHRIVSTLEWKPVMRSGPAGLNMFVPSDPQTTFEMRARSVLQIDGGGVGGGYDIRAELRDFTVNLFSDRAPAQFISVRVRRILFTASDKAKPDVDCQVDSVSFHGALKFVEELSALCRFRGDGLAIDVTPSGISASAQLAIPSLSFGAFTLRNMAFGAGIALPFDGSGVRIRFNFCTRESPFQLTISGFGGGGFVGLAIGADGLELLEFSFEFGAGIAIDLGVASGSVELMGGIHFLLETINSAQSVALTAYLRLNGELNVLGLVSMSLEFYLGLTYASGPDRLVGEARMTVSIEVLFFSDSVTLTVRREIRKDTQVASTSSLTGVSSAVAALDAAAEPATVSFGDTYTDTDWRQYCAAYAPVGA